MSTELAIRETILGTLRAKDTSGRNVIHSSDFRAAITDLGYSMGSTIVENILVYCKLDNNGNIDFSELERELSRERRLVNAQKKTEVKVIPTSSGVTQKPWRGDVIHKNKLELEKQMLTVTEHGQEVHEIYYALSHHEINPRDAVSTIESLDIYPTKAFLKLVQTMVLSDVSYSDFVRSLTKFDPNQADLDTQSVSAGGYRPKPLEREAIEHKRIHSGNIPTAFYETNQMKNDKLKTNNNPKTFRKMVKNGPVNDSVIFKTQLMKETIFAEDSPVALLSHNQSDMVKGQRGEEVSPTFTVDHRLQREQVYAALRKLDAGSISMEDFQDILFALNIELTEQAIAEIRRNVISGRMDVRKLMKHLDATIFKDSAIEEKMSGEIERDQIVQRKFIKCLLRQLGLDALHSLTVIFTKMDKDGDGSLTYSEFRNGCNRMQLLSLSYPSSYNDVEDDDDESIREEDLKRLFHAFDKNGDGVLSYQELLLALIGDFPAKRKAMVKKAFAKLDRFGEKSIRMETLADSFQAEASPLVKQQLKTEREVRNDMIHWFSVHPLVEIKEKEGEMIPYEAFEQYFASFSPAIARDEDFAQMILACFALSAEKAPPPPLFKLKKGKQANDTPMAIQSHGDLVAWQQEASQIEEQGRLSESQKGIKYFGGYLQRNGQSDVIKWANHAGISKSKEESVRDDLKLHGMVNLSSGKKNISDRSTFAWNTSKNKANNNNNNSPSSNQPGSSRGKMMDTVIAVSPVVNLPYQEEYKMAGNVTTVINQQKDLYSMRPSSAIAASKRIATQKQQEEYLKPKPFGTDDVVSDNSNNSFSGRSGNNPKSLMEVMKGSNSNNSGKGSFKPLSAYAR